jgi:SAM-dependent methyltransferase
MNPISRRIAPYIRDAVWSAIHWWKALPLPGFHCPVCARNVAGMMPLGKDFIEPRRRFGNPYQLEDMETLNFRDYNCPRCGASDRERLYALYFSERLGNENVRLLDVAPPPALSAFLRKFPNLERRTADLFRTDVDDQADITNMPLYTDGRFDAFICSHVLEHVNDDRAAMRELHRILRPGGWGIAMVPVNSKAVFDEDPGVTDIGERWRRFGQFDHVRTYTRYDFVRRLTEAGFVVRQLGIEHFGAETFSRCAITPTSILYVVEKPEQPQA